LLQLHIIKHYYHIYSSSSSNSQQKSKINDIKQVLKHFQAFEKIVIFQWVPSHVGPEGNEIADKLAKKGTTLHTKETPTQGDSLKNLLNRKIATQYKQEANELAATKKWTDNHKIWAAHKGKPRKEVVANFRLNTGYDCLAACIRKICIHESSECTICHVSNSATDEEHLLHCPNLIPTNKCSTPPPNCWDATAMMRQLLQYLP
jgi:hypothetical protein